MYKKYYYMKLIFYCQVLRKNYLFFKNETEKVKNE